MLGVIFQQAVIVLIAFHQDVITELTFGRSCLQGWFLTCHEFRYSLLVGYDFRVGLTTGIVLGLALQHVMILVMVFQQAKFVVLAL